MHRSTATAHHFDRLGNSKFVNRSNITHVGRQATIKMAEKSKIDNSTNALDLCRY